MVSVYVVAMVRATGQSQAVPIGVSTSVNQHLHVLPTLDIHELLGAGYEPANAADATEASFLVAAENYLQNRLPAWSIFDPTAETLESRFDPVINTWIPVGNGGAFGWVIQRSGSPGAPILGTPKVDTGPSEKTVELVGYVVVSSDGGA